MSSFGSSTPAAKKFSNSLADQKFQEKFDDMWRDSIYNFRDKKYDRKQIRTKFHDPVSSSEDESPFNLNIIQEEEEKTVRE